MKTIAIAVVILGAGTGCNSDASSTEGVDGGSEAAPIDGAGPDVATGGETGPPDASSSSGAWVLGYYPSWDSPHNGGSYAVSSIDWDGLTHVAAAFYVPDSSGNWVAGYFDQATATELISAAHAHGKKAIASIGGASSGVAFEGSTSSGNMTKFVSNLEALITLGYDGLDIDWEGGNLSAAQDQALQTSLVAALRKQSPSILITLTAGYENENSLDDLSFYAAIAPQLDRINLMTYGMAGAWQGWQSWHTSPLHWDKNSATPTGIDASVGHYLAAGVPASKLGIGTGFFGMCYTAPVSAPSQPLGGTQVAASDGVMSFTNILASYYSPSAYHYDSAAEAPYLTLSGANAKKCTYVSYEDATSLAAKAAYVKTEKLGGIIIWTISEGFVSSGSTVQAQNPLLEVLKVGLLK